MLAGTLWESNCTQLELNQRPSWSQQEILPLNYECVLFPERIELSSSSCKDAVLPLDYGNLFQAGIEPALFPVWEECFTTILLEHRNCYCVFFCEPSRNRESNPIGFQRNTNLVLLKYTQFQLPRNRSRRSRHFFGSGINRIRTCTRQRSISFQLTTSTTEDNDAFGTCACCYWESNPN